MTIRHGQIGVRIIARRCLMGRVSLIVFLLISSMTPSISQADTTQSDKAGSVQAQASNVMSSALKIAAGEHHTCVVTGQGGVKCWGGNAQGQLGDGTTIDRFAPVDVLGFGNGVTVTEVVVGHYHTCALTALGGVKCWGWNYAGQLGNNTQTWPQTIPSDVVGLGSGVTAIAAGNEHTCAAMLGGGGKCWGGNQNGQLGRPGPDGSLVPVDVSGLSEVVSTLSAGDQHTCALTITGGIKCWGSNESGQLGDGTTPDRSSVPVNVFGLTNGVSAISSDGFHTCALTSANGGVKCWGANLAGQLGSSTTLTTPVDVSGLTSGVSAITTGNLHSCAALVAGGVKCWGGNQNSPLGDGTTTNRFTPVAVIGVNSRVGVLAAGSGHTCASVIDGGIQCWGNNVYGQLGDGTTSRNVKPLDVSGLTDGVKSIVAGTHNTCAVMVTGAVKCWNDTVFFASDVPELTNGVIGVASGFSHTCVLMNTGSVKCWGDNGQGQLGDGTATDQTTPIPVSGLTQRAIAITGGGNHTCVLTITGGVTCWGDNVGGSTPADIPALTSGISAIAAGTLNICALTTAGAVKCWGPGFSNEIPGPVVVDIGAWAIDMRAISVGYGHTCALKVGGSVQCLGQNTQGQLGDGTTTSRSVPGDVLELSRDVSAIASGGGHSCVVTTAGGVKCWGSNFNGELGNGSTMSRTVPTDVVGLTSGVSSVTVGHDHTCVLMSTGGVKCWGGMVDGPSVPPVITAPVDVVGSACCMQDWEFSILMPVALRDE